MFFDATTVAPDAGASSTPIPAGTYLAMITASELKPTKANNGQYLKLEFTVLDGEFKGRKVFDNLNIQNTNAQAQQIAQARLSAICHAVNVLRPMGSEQLHHIPLKIVLTIKLASGEYSASNLVRGVEAVSAAPGTPVTPPAPAPFTPPPAAKAQAAPAAAANVPAWARKA